MNKLERGLEMSLIAVVHLGERSAYALSIHQSVEQSALKVAKEKLCSRSEELQQLSRLLALCERGASMWFCASCGDHHELKSSGRWVMVVPDDWGRRALT